MFTIFPFAPDKLPGNWRVILRAWLSGEPLAAVAAGQEAETLQFVEGALVYRLPWAMEAIRVRGVANGEAIGDFFTLDDFPLGLAVAAVETGTISRSAAVLIQAGFNSRLAAIKAVNDTGADFSTLAELQVWLASDPVQALGQIPDWPTAETKEIWGSFIAGFVPREARTWSERRYWAWVQWHSVAVIPPVGAPLRVAIIDGIRFVTAPDGEVIGELQATLNPARRGLVRAEVLAEANKIAITYFGPDDLWAA